MQLINRNFVVDPVWVQVIAEKVSFSILFMSSKRRVTESK
jgi:hypothetical protein